MEALDIIRSIIVDIDEDILESDIIMSTNLIDDFGFDSIIIVQMVMEIEERLNIEFDQQDLVLDRLSEISKLVKIIDNKLSINS